MKYPVTATLLWAFGIVQLGHISPSLPVYAGFMVLGIHLGLAIMPHKKVSLWPVKATPKNKAHGVAMKP